MRTKKTYIILIALILIFFVVMFLLFGLDNFLKEKYDTTIIVDNNTVWTYKNKKWKNVSKPYNDLSWKKYNVYLNNEKSGNYYLWYNDKWYAFDDKKNAVLLDGNLLGVRANYDISVYNFDVSEIDDYSYVDEILEKNSISEPKEYTANYKIVFDYDNDDILEEFYVVSNVFPMDTNPEKVFSIVFMVKDSVIYPIYTDVQRNTSFNGCKPYFNTFLDIDEDNKYEFVLSCAPYSVSKTNSMLYGFKDNSFKIIISN